MARQLPPDPLYILRGSRSPITSLYSSDSSSGILYSGNQDGQVLIWDMVSKRVTATLEAHPKSSVLWLQVIAGNRLLTQGRDGKIKIWECLNLAWVVKAQFSCSAQVFCGSLVFHHGDASYIALPGDKSSKIDIININTLQFTYSLTPKHNKHGMCMCLKYAGIDDDGNQLLLIAYENGNVVLWEVISHQTLDELEMYQDSIMCMDFSEKCSKGLCGSVNNILISFKIENMKLIKGETIEVINEGFSSISIRPDNKLFVTTGWDGVIRLFSFKSWKPLAVLKYHKDNVQCSVFLPDNTLICGSKDKLISLWKIYT